MPIDSNSFLNSPAFIARHFSISAVSFSARDAAVAVDVSFSVVVVVVVVLELLVSSLITVERPSLRAFTRASTSSVFSKNVLVLIPIDSSSFLIAPARMALISSFTAAEEVVSSVALLRKNVVRVLNEAGLGLCMDGVNASVYCVCCCCWRRRRSVNTS